MCVCGACLCAVLCVCAMCMHWCRGQKYQLLSLSTLKTWDRDSHWTGSSPLWLDLTTDKLQGSICPRPWMVGYKPTLPCSAFYMGSENMNSGLHACTVSPLLTELPPQSHSHLSRLANIVVVSLHLVTYSSLPSSRFFFVLIKPSTGQTQLSMNFEFILGLMSGSKTVTDKMFYQNKRLQYNLKF